MGSESDIDDTAMLVSKDPCDSSGAVSSGNEDCKRQGAGWTEPATNSSCKAGCKPQGAEWTEPATNSSGGNEDSKRQDAKWMEPTTGSGSSADEPCVQG